MDELLNVACFTVGGSVFFADSAFASGETQEKGSSFLVALAGAASTVRPMKTEQAIVSPAQCRSHERELPAGDVWRIQFTSVS
jgi:hypothetical protein